MYFIYVCVAIMKNLYAQQASKSKKALNKSVQRRKDKTTYRLSAHHQNLLFATISCIYYNNFEVLIIK